MKQKITTNLHLGKTFEDVYTSFIVSKTSLGISASTINNYKYHLHTIGRYTDSGLTSIRAEKVKWSASLGISKTPSPKRSITASAVCEAQNARH